MNKAHQMLEEAKPVLAILTACGIEHCIAGGFPRDVQHVRAPKDLDIFVWSASAEDIQGAYTVLESIYAVEVHLGYDDAGDGRIWCVVKLPDKNIDIVVYSAHSKEEVVERFDCNLSQYLLIDDEPVFAGHNEGTLCFVADDLNEQRIEYMQNKAREYGWEVPA